MVSNYVVDYNYWIAELIFRFPKWKKLCNFLNFHPLDTKYDIRNDTSALRVEDENDLDFDQE